MKPLWRVSCGSSLRVSWETRAAAGCLCRLWRRTCSLCRCEKLVIENTMIFFLSFFRRLETKFDTCSVSTRLVTKLRALNIYKFVYSSCVLNISSWKWNISRQCCRFSAHVVCVGLLFFFFYVLRLFLHVAQEVHQKNPAQTIKRTNRPQLIVVDLEQYLIDIDKWLNVGLLFFFSPLVLDIF